MAAQSLGSDPRVTLGVTGNPKREVGDRLWDVISDDKGDESYCVWRDCSLLRKLRPLKQGHLVLRALFAV